MDKIVILDTLNFIYKGAIKFQDNEEQISPDFTLVYNFFKNLRALIQKLTPNKIFAVKEGQNNFRYKLLEGYKANRIVKFAAFKTKEESDNFNRQRDIIFDLLKYLPITVVSHPNYEGDDIIASLSDNLREENIVIVSNDKDLIQVLQKAYKSVQIYNPFKKVYVEAPKYFQLVWLSLAGDSSDCIPSIVGKKKATTLASNPEALAKFLESNEEARIQFKDNMELIALRLVPMDELVFEEHQVNFGVLKEEFRNMKFESLIRTETWTKIIDTFKVIKL